MRAVLCVALLVASVCRAELLVDEFGPDDAPMRVMFVCGLHPREVITREVCDEWVKELRDRPPMGMRIVVVPNANPEGVKRWEQDPCWRGNDRGVDLNRNWPLIPCEPPAEEGDYVPAFAEREWSHGTDPMSEWETRELDALLRRVRPHLFIAVHSGLEALLTPFDACARSPINYHDHVKLGKWLRRDICDTCIVARSPRLLYYSRGTMTDYAYHYLQVPMVMTLEIFEGPEPSTISDCSTLFSPPPRTIMHAQTIRRWRRLMTRLLDIDSDDYVALLDMVGVVELD